MKRLEVLAKTAAKSLMRCDSVRVISHNDADGLASAGLICSALIRAKIPFHATIVSRLDNQVIDSLEPPVVFCDMGSGKPDLVSRLSGDVFVFDHHRPVRELDCVHVNPHLAGIDGAFELSASGVAYAVARNMGGSSVHLTPDSKNNVDLAGLALVGAIGDRQAMVGANKSILDEAMSLGVVETRPGMRMRDGPLDEIFERSIDPFLDITGDSIKVVKFLEEIDLHGELQNLGQNDLSRLATAIVLKLLMQGSFAVDSVVGDTFRLKRELVENAYEMVELLNACGKLGKTGIGVALCMRDDSVLEECRAVADEYRRKVLAGMVLLKDNIRDMGSIRYSILSNMEAAGVLAGMGIRYLYPDKPLLVMNRVEDLVKVSARGNRVLVSKGLDLSIAVRNAAESVGGVGGGHNVASGAAVPPGTEETFLRCVDEVVYEQLHGQLAGMKG